MKTGWFSISIFNFAIANGHIKASRVEFSRKRHIFSEDDHRQAAPETLFINNNGCRPRMNTPPPSYRRSKRPFSSLSCPPSSLSSSSSDENDDIDNDRPHKKLALSLNRLALSSTPNPEPKDIEMRVPRSYEKNSFTTVIQSLSTTTTDTEDDDIPSASRDAPFPGDEAHVTILSEIEKRLTQFPHKLLSPSSNGVPDTALVLYRSPESMGLPKLERQKQEEMKAAMRKRILEKRWAEKNVAKDDGYEADAEDWEESPPQRQSTAITNGVLGNYNGGHLNQFGSQVNGYDMGEDDEDDDEGERMDLD